MFVAKLSHMRGEPLERFGGDRAGLKVRDFGVQNVRRLDGDPSLGKVSDHRLGVTYDNCVLVATMKYC